MFEFIFIKMETEPGVPDKVESKTTTKTWIQAYPEISGKSFPMDTVHYEICIMNIGNEDDWPDLNRGGGRDE